MCCALLFFWFKIANFSNVWVAEWWATDLLTEGSCKLRVDAGGED